MARASSFSESKKGPPKTSSAGLLVMHAFAALVPDAIEAGLEAM